MIDILIYLTMILHVHPTLCEQETAFRSVPPLHLHHIWQKQDNTSGITPFLSCVPSGAKYTLRYIDK